MARATVMRPALLLADEPTGNLDSKSGAAVLEMLDDLNGNGLTLLVVTHNPKVAQRADRILFLVDGRIARRVPGENVAELVALLTEDE